MNDSGKRLSREDWLARALATLDREGIQGVKVERLAESLGVTKGSFYWHFENLQDLLDSLLNYWSVELTEVTLGELDRMPDDPGHRLLWLLGRIAEGSLNEHDRGMRTWATQEPAVAELVRSVDEKRLAYVRELFLDMGFADCDAELRSRMSYYYVIGEQTAGLDVTPESRTAHIEPRHRLLTDPRFKTE
ncbi:MAG: TetR/AcrR family transcriptional regulator [Gemmatimonadota bacterium]